MSWQEVRGVLLRWENFGPRVVRPAGGSDSCVVAGTTLSWNKLTAAVADWGPHTMMSFVDLGCIPIRPL